MASIEIPPPQKVGKWELNQTIIQFCFSIVFLLFIIFKFFKYYRFMESFSQVSDTGEVLVVPTDVLDKWFSRFNEKFQRDPNFMMKRT